MLNPLCNKEHGIQKEEESGKDKKGKDEWVLEKVRMGWKEGAGKEGIREEK